MLVAAGSYTGNGSAQSIAGLGFQPDWLFLKGGANIAICRTDTMATDAAKQLTVAIAISTGRVTSIDADGFSVGSDAQANAADTVYHYLAGTEDGVTAATVTYTGNGADNRQIACGFVPDFVLVMAGHGQTAYWHTSDMPQQVLDADLTSQSFDGSLATDRIQQVHATDGFVVGVQGSVNTNASTYHALCLKTEAGVFDTFTYVGTGVSHSVGAVGFTPHAALTKRGTASTIGAMRLRNHTGSRSTFVNTTTPDDVTVTALASGGFTVDTGASANTLSGVYYAAVWRATNGDGSGPTDPAGGGGSSGRNLSLMGVG